MQHSCIYRKRVIIFATPLHLVIFLKMKEKPFSNLFFGSIALNNHLQLKKNIQNAQTSD